MATDNQISAAVDACLALMNGEFCLQTLQANDASYDWEFKAVERLYEDHGVTGLYVLSHDIMVTVCFQDGMSEEETCLVIAHELGHHWLHRNLPIERQAHDAGMIMRDERREAEAETFAKLMLDRCGICMAAEANAWLARRG